MRHLKRWAQSKYKPLAMFAQTVAVSADAFCRLLLIAREREMEELTCGVRDKERLNALYSNPDDAFMEVPELREQFYSRRNQLENRGREIFAMTLGQEPERNMTPQRIRYIGAALIMLSEQLWKAMNIFREGVLDFFNNELQDYFISNFCSIEYFEAKGNDYILLINLNDDDIVSTIELLTEFNRNIEGQKCNKY